MLDEDKVLKYTSELYDHFEEVSKTTGGDTAALAGLIANLVNLISDFYEL